MSHKEIISSLFCVRLKKELVDSLDNRALLNTYE